jgi:predicted porin
MMRQSLCTLLLLAGLAGASAPLVAQEGAYARAQLGQAQLDFVDDEDVAFGAAVGYRFTPNFGAEIGYYDLGSGRRGGVATGGAIPEIDSRSFTVGLDARYPLESEARGFFLGGRLGVHWYKNEGVANVTGLSVGFDNSDNDLYFGVGVGYAFNERFDVALNWTRFNGDIEVPASGNRARFAVSQDIDMVGLSAEFRF